MRRRRPSVGVAGTPRCTRKASRPDPRADHAVGAAARSADAPPGTPARTRALRTGSRSPRSRPPPGTRRARATAAPRDQDDAITAEICSHTICSGGFGPRSSSSLRPWCCNRAAASAAGNTSREEVWLARTSSAGIRCHWRTGGSTDGASAERFTPTARTDGRGRLGFGRCGGVARRFLSTDAVDRSPKVSPPSSGRPHRSRWAGRHDDGPRGVLPFGRAELSTPSWRLTTMRSTTAPVAARCAPTGRGGRRRRCEPRRGGGRGARVGRQE